MPRSDLGGVLRQVEQLFNIGTLSAYSDAALLRRYVSDRDEEAFAGLVARHGPMVLSVCRSILRDHALVEDAFQATFLVLVRRARSIWIDASLGGWLHEVACRVALRARGDLARRQTREQGEIRIDDRSDRSESPARSLERELHEEIARLPAAYRKAVVLCYLEGITQSQAANELGCGEATLRRRLATARERLRHRLGGRSLDAETAIPLVAERSSLPAEWIKATVHATTTAMSSQAAPSARVLLAAAAIKSLDRVRNVRIVAAIALSAGSAIAVTAGVTLRNEGQREAPPVRIRGTAPAQTAAPKVQASAPEHWVHIRYDDGMERWVCLDNARELWKAGVNAGSRDPDTNSELIYRGDGPIERRDRAIWSTDENRPKTFELLVRSGVEVPDLDKLTPGRASDDKRKDFPVFFDYEIESVDGHRCLRIDRFTRNTLGEARMDEQTWVDLETKRPRRRRELLQTALQAQFKREYRTSEFEYTPHGPPDLFALGVPAGTKVVNQAVLNAPVESDAIRRVLIGGSKALERLPLNYRLLEESDGRLDLTYWSSPAQFMHDWCATMRGENAPSIYGAARPRFFFADHQGRTEIPSELRQKLSADPLGDLPVGKVLSWFPMKDSVNMRVRDGKRSFTLTRFAANPGEARPVRLHVLEDQGWDLPRPIHDLWPFLQAGHFLKAVPAEPGTPKHLIALNAEYETVRSLWHCDPAHDFIAVRQVDWRKVEDRWVKNEEWNAARFRELPGGLKYVSTWTGSRHVRVRGVDQAGKPIDHEEDQPVTKRLNIAPLTAGQFPPGIFDGNKLLETAREEKAIIKVD